MSKFKGLTTAYSSFLYVICIIKTKFSSNTNVLFFLNFFTYDNNENVLLINIDLLFIMHNFIKFPFKMPEIIPHTLGGGFEILASIFYKLKYLRICQSMSKCWYISLRGDRNFLKGYVFYLFINECTQRYTFKIEGTLKILCWPQSWIQYSKRKFRNEEWHRNVDDFQSDFFIFRTCGQ